MLYTVAFVAALAWTALAGGPLAPGARAQRQDVESYRMARSLALRGQADRALRVLEEELDRGLAIETVMRDAAWDGLRTHPRLRELLREAGTVDQGWLAPDGEPGRPLRLDLTFRDPAGEPLVGVDVYAYQTDAGGRYSATDDNRNPRLYTYVRTDESGRIVLHTIRPASYPGTNVPQHVHLEVGDRLWVGEILFADDPLVTDAGVRAAEARGWPVVSVTDGQATAAFEVDRPDR